MRKAIGLALVVLAVGMAPGRSVLADVSPGDKINASNVDKVKDLLSPGLLVVRQARLPDHDLRDEARRVAEGVQGSHREVRAAGEAVGRRPRACRTTSPGSRSRTSTPKDPQFALKIMWNYDYGFVNGVDDTDLRNFDADTGSIPQDGPMTVERHFLLDHFRRLFWNAPALRRSEAGEAEPQRVSRAAGPLSHPRAVRPEGRRRARQPLHRLREAGRLLALPAVAPARAAALHGAALGRALRAGHRRRQLLRLRRPDRLDGLEVPRRARRSSPPSTPSTSP